MSPMTAGTMSTVTSLQSAVSAAQHSRWLAEAMSRWSWFTSMNRKSWSGESTNDAVRYLRAALSLYGCLGGVDAVSINYPTLF